MHKIKNSNNQQQLTNFEKYSIFYMMDLILKKRLNKKKMEFIY